MGDAMRPGSWIRRRCVRLESPWGTVDLGRSGRDPGKIWKGSTASGIAVTVFPAGSVWQGNAGAVYVCRVPAGDRGGQRDRDRLHPYAEAQPAASRVIGIWSPRDRLRWRGKATSWRLTAFSSGHGLDAKLLPPQAPAPAPASATKKGQYCEERAGDVEVRHCDDVQGRASALRRRELRCATRCRRGFKVSEREQRRGGWERLLPP